MKKIIFIFILLGRFSMFSQSVKSELTIISFSELEKLYEQNPKPIVVFIYTEWCKYCLGMKKNTFKNEKIIRILNNQFYFLKLNGEEKKDIKFIGETFTYKPKGTNTGIHELAFELASIKKRIIYPTTTILNSKLEIMLQLNGYINSQKMSTLLHEVIKLNQK
jgi:thioredoxin-related protein